MAEQMLWAQACLGDMLRVVLVLQLFMDPTNKPRVQSLLDTL